MLWDIIPTLLYELSITGWHNIGFCMVSIGGMKRTKHWQPILYTQDNVINAPIAIVMIIMSAFH